MNCTLTKSILKEYKRFGQSQTEQTLSLSVSIWASKDINTKFRKDGFRASTPKHAQHYISSLHAQLSQATS